MNAIRNEIDVLVVGAGLVGLASVIDRILAAGTKAKRVTITIAIE